MKSRARPVHGPGLRTLMLAAPLIILATPVAAQTASGQTPSDQTTSGEAATEANAERRDIVVVTGIGPARTSDELIASTSVLEASDVQERLAGGLGDTLAGLPGVASTAFAPGASRPIIRGLGAERVQVLTNGIGIVDASAASPDHAVTADPLGVERIEILRGPASLAYGGGATGGVINVIDGLIVEHLPQRDALGAVYAGLTSVDEGKQGAARLTATLGQVVGALSATGLDAGDIDIPGFALSAAARNEAVASGADPADFASRTLPNSRVATESLSAGLSWVGERAFLGGAARRLESAYGNVAEETVFIDMEQTRLDLRGGIDLDGAVRSLKAWGSSVEYEHTEFEDPVSPGTMFLSQGWEARIEAAHAPLAGLEGAIGLQMSERDLAAIGAESLIGPTQTRQTGAFVYEAHEQAAWTLEGGLRFDAVDVDSLVGGVRSFEAWNASFGAHMHVGDHLFVGASVARTERAPRDIELFADGPHLATAQFEVGDDTLEIEEGVNIELTARFENDAFNISGSLYRFDFDSFIYLKDTGAIDPGDPIDPQDDLPVFQFVQAGAVFTGTEISAVAQLGRALGVDWTADGSVDFVRAELDAGGSLPLIPPMTVNVGIEGEWDRYKARIEAQYGARQDQIAAFETPTEDFLTLEARLGVELREGVRLMLEARNLTDEEVRVHSSPLKEAAPLAGRNLRVALLVEF